MISSHLRSCQADYLYRENFDTLELKGKSPFYCRYGQKDLRRDLDPSNLSNESTWCFCKLEDENFLFSPSTRICLLNDRAHLYSCKCGPEPTNDHFRSMAELMFKVDGNFLNVVNLNNSGASVPQHFHTQIYPLNHFGEKQNSIQILWNNVGIKLGKHEKENEIEIVEIKYPVWGIRFRFPVNFTPIQIGDFLYQCVHCGIRYQSQLSLTYNLYWESSNAQEVTVLFRQSSRERMFQLDEVHELLLQFTTRSEMNRIVRSNRFWRWAWLEIIGGFPARDNSFKNTKIFNWYFWYELLKIASIDSDLQEQLFRKIKDEIIAFTVLS